jgi:hypothetical protein
MAFLRISTTWLMVTKVPLVSSFFSTGSNGADRPQAVRHLVEIREDHLVPDEGLVREVQGVAWEED